MNNVSWPVVALVAVIAVALTVLGVTHNIDQAWLERTFSALVGLALGNMMGAKGFTLPRMMRKEPTKESTTIPPR